MSTADCKDLLVKHYPQTLAKEWKRESKYLNFNEHEIRRFRHPVAGLVLVNEYRQTISTDEVDLEFRQKSSLMAQDFYFCVVMNTGSDFPAQAFVSIVYRPFFDAEGYMDSIHLESVMEKLFPRGIECYEEMESVFAVEEELPLDSIMEKFTKAGFVSSQDFDRLIRQSCGLSEESEVSLLIGASGNGPAKAGDFYFMIDSSLDIEEHIQVYLTNRSYYDKHGYVQSIHIKQQVKHLFPNGLECDEEMESCFAIREISDPLVVSQMFIDSGFIPMPQSADQEKLS